MLVVPRPAAQEAAPPPFPAPGEARVRARLLHAALDGALRVMHRDFFRKGGDSKIIPSQSLEDVFRGMEKTHGVTLRWLAAEETVMNEVHRAADAFQKRALKALAGGEKEISSVESGVLRYAGVIVLQNQCLKCHVPQRTSLEDRFSALEISMPVKVAPEPDKP